MIRDWRGIHERPEHWCITPDPTHPYRRGAVFLGLAGNRCHHSLRFHDSSLYGSHGTLTNMEPASDWLWDATLGRWVLDFDGSDDYVTGSWNLSSYPICLGGWVYFGGSNVNGAVVTIANPTLNNYLACSFASTGKARAQASGDVATDQSANSTQNYALNSWNHIVAVYYSSSSAFCWLNGVRGAERTTNIGAIVGHTNVSVGALLTAGGTYWRTATRVSDPFIVKRILSPSEIAQLADPSNVMLSGLILPPKRRFWSVSAAAPTYRFPIELMGAY